MAKKVKVDLDLLKECASNGYSIAMTARLLSVSRTYFYKHIKHTFELAQDEARKRVIANLFAHSGSEGGFQSAKYLSEKLHIFDEYVPTSKPTDAKDVLSKMGDIFLMVSKNELSTEKADKLMTYLEKILKSYETSELQSEVEKIKAQLDDQKGY